MYISPWQPEPALTALLRNWLQANRSWYLRHYEEDDTQYPLAWAAPSIRHATTDEVAAEIVDDPALREALGFLTSRDGQAVEEAVTCLWLPSEEAQILTAALTLAWQAVLDQNRPVWQRSGVLVGTCLGALGLIALAGRMKR